MTEKEDSDYALLLECLYTTTWNKLPGHRCHRVVIADEPVKATFSERDLYLHNLYVQMEFIYKTVDCYNHHSQSECYERMSKGDSKLGSQVNQINKAYLKQSTKR